MKKTIYFVGCLLLMMLGFNNSKAQTLSSASFFVDTTCTSSSGIVNVSGCISGLKLFTYYGDGTMDSISVFCSGSGATVWLGHGWGTSGTYTIKHVLKNNFTRFDSLTYTHEFRTCSHIWLEAWADLNSNCILDGADHGIVAPGLIRVDSSGVPIDTITAYCSYNYKAYGPPGTIYKFTAVVPPTGMTTCAGTAVILDTIPMFPAASHTYKYWLLQCGASSGFDLGISANFRPAAAGAFGNRANIAVYNASCTGTAATVKFEYSPKFGFTSIYPPVSHTVTGTTLVFDAGTISSTAPKDFTIQLSPVLPLTMGDTVNTRYSVMPTTGDANPINNVVVRCDTVRASYDPNQKSVTPTGNIVAGARLEYMLEFENTGSDTAYNIHIMDTLSAHLDYTTITPGASTHQYSLSSMPYGAGHVLKFDFPNILLPDTTHHTKEICRGMVLFQVNAKSTLPLGTTIANRVGIYFDANPVVMTNTVYSKIPVPVSVNKQPALVGVTVYPNPVQNMLHVAAQGITTGTVTIYNATGQVVATQPAMVGGTDVATHMLVPGIYYVVVKGDGGVKAVKFEKL